MPPFTNYGPYDYRKYQPAFDPNVDTTSAPDSDQFQNTAPPVPRALALQPRQPGEMGARNPLADLQENYQDVGTKLQSALQPHPISTPRALISALVSSRNPQLGAIISGDYQRQRAIQPLAAQYQNLGTQIATERANENQEVENRLKNAEAYQKVAEAGGYPAKQALENAQAEAANYKEDPNLGLIDLRTKQPVNPAGLAPLTAQEAAVLGKEEGERVPLKLKNTANEIVNRGITTVNTEEGVFERNRGTSTGSPATMTRMGSNPRALFAPSEKYVPVVDPKNPGRILYQKVGEAAAAGNEAPSSADAAAAKKEATSEVPTNIGDQTVAFKTMIDHAQLLRNAARELHNGNVQALAGMKNDFKNAFGYSGPITAQAIADAYGGEVTNVIEKGHITDKGNEKVAHTIDPSKQNYETLDSVLSAYQNLAQSKLKNLMDQANKAKNPNAAPAPAAGEHPFFSKFGGIAKTQ